MDIELFLDMLDIDSTSGKEAGFADFLAGMLEGAGRRIETFEVGDGTKNILVSWGVPKVIFCSHLDTVPPYISPRIISSPSSVMSNPSSVMSSPSSVMSSLSSVMSSEVETSPDTIFCGRGTCDAKGQIFAMYQACLELEKQGYTDFGLLLLAGEETGSYGAKAFNAMVAEGKVQNFDEAQWVVVGEPTDNCMASAAKGTKSFEIEFEGEAFHSGYPEHGRSAVMMFNDFVNALRSIGFPSDPVLGETTWNIGKLHSDNPQNILSDRLTCRVYFRTTFESDEMVCNVMKNIAGPQARLRFGRPRVQDGSDIVAKDVVDWQRYMKVTAFGGDAPTRFEVLEGFPVKPVSFGSDAPQLTAFGHKILCGPGSIHVAHRPDEQITLQELETAVGNYVRMYMELSQKNK